MRDKRIKEPGIDYVHHSRKEQEGGENAGASRSSHLSKVAQ